MVIVTFPKSIMKFTDLPTSDSGYTTAEGEQPKPSAPLTHKQLLERNPKDTENVTSRLATEIRALKTYHISKDLVGLAPRRGWPSHEAKEEVMSPRMKERLARLRGDINGLLRRAFKSSPKNLQQALDDDYGCFNLLWFPDISSYDSYDDLLTVSLYCTWLFVWDDLTDSNDTSFSLDDGLGTDFERACFWREETVKLAWECIVGGDDDGDDGNDQLLYSPGSNMDDNMPDSSTSTLLTGSQLILHEFGKRIRKSSRLNQAQRDRLFQETVRYIKGCEMEQAQRLAGYLPKSGEEIFSEIPIPDWVFYSPEMRTIWKDGNFLVVVYNDILSFKKELATDSLINIIPIFYSSGGIPWDEVMPTIGDSIEAAVQRIDEATQKLIAMTRDNLELEKAVVQFIDGIKVNVTGNIGYSIATKRYSSLFKNLNEDGTLVIQL
ncbi:hypothetical protein SMACR_03009 [Sordaria macrospora]|uniref:Terpene synthase n=2 Tax=Sordaria macrospora TaxID=5147 RepID=F7VUH7_SORMK|nr:uncharacterized protein SMAC_03009 [Sordaria macrospora k-hell]KAA8629438.1 hypothetical protein SMACR_03009 [Sordaria macrospora]WPJ61841.1 hypothetical protein SMAC4_03009 [Sordaria macrospora]CCC09166.1 unnamed protein product [Sordaria macrospora k-hell]